MKRLIVLFLIIIFTANVCIAAAKTEASLGVGLFGGGGGLKTILTKRISPLLTLGVDLTYGLGGSSQSYSLSGIEVFARRDINAKVYFAATISQISYSESVELQVLNKTVRKGGCFGGGIAVGIRPYLSSPLVLELGYHTTLGISLTGQFKVFEL
ncbi:hypothetical protein A2291_08485 [candidate division WOR-1 bacterium RIFOXYB2_FULL_42_35]|uniref:Uncharacterized protein n=1 Tax=candidate division WOR-1 bacterium RIFOXYC2_FULL_41_25 TaxID=1802586 RepID=A0A1F4TM38_UNCSA|nr:MAG: hypothetical protein A2247_05180 [candidate division WOR-1 bacterium RIFOXYA2_FULL_41_14]OGC23881.1 MAG: hypothetical protein A2291_08485 [candidate division WOR-1 bacterium RIFOXYB2_FULL_42_35]OGC33756.1 MAG: hypothetical protein A2462_00575 [candidate division WOR-1 bacterium RIFOXYC2_FULL_41_25]OGC44177.1 MAG: hypothetical protein A2548_02945 [candidate division WOR-1 bacterium RIFOXYD2_FULL_41_8]